MPEISDHKDLISVGEAREAVEAAHRAFLAVARFDQARIDRICEAMSRAALADAARLGLMAHEETGFGVADDKREKNRFAAQDVWNYFKNLKTVGVVGETESVVEIASPRGVVAAIVPSTNPTSTAIFKILISIKSRNSLVLSPHPSASRSIAETARVLREAGAREGLPPEAIGCLVNSSIEGTEALMKHKLTAVILATGGIGLVRAAYSSGKPAFGVGPGNVPVFVEKTADVAKAARDILTGTCFDNGTICASEQSVVADASIAGELREQFRAQGAHFLNQTEAEAVGKILLTPQRTLNPGIVGKPAEYIANLAGVGVPPGTRCLIADCAGVGRDFPWSIEKLSPTLAFFVASGIEEGAARCLEILQFGGMGHTAGMHTRSREAAVSYGERMPASRVVINSPTTHGAIGFSTDLAPSMTLGCGSWGGNVTSDNVSPLHLLDIKRVAFETKPVAGAAVSNREEQSAGNFQSAPPPQTSVQSAPPTLRVKREEIAALVDGFLRRKIAETPVEAAAPDPLISVRAESSENQENPNPQIADRQSDNPVKTIIHELKNEASSNGAKPKATDFVSETDVKQAIERGEKIYVTAKTIITPSARDLGEEREIFARV